jgi:hypothetical protein
MVDVEVSVTGRASLYRGRILRCLVPWVPRDGRTYLRSLVNDEELFKLGAVPGRLEVTGYGPGDQA